MKLCLVGSSENALMPRWDWLMGQCCTAKIDQWDDASQGPMRWEIQHTYNDGYKVVV